MSDLRGTSDDLVPIVMGGGRPLFPGPSIADVPLGHPEGCVTSARMPILRPDPS